MTAYRLFFFDAAEHIRHAIVLECEDDEEAVRVVAQHADGRAMELWQRARLVQAFPSRGEIKPPR